MTAAARLLPLLTDVREIPARPGRTRSWRALCPAHDDHRPSLDVDQLDDRLLLCCRTGCSAGDVIAAVGLNWSDLFDRPLEHNRPGVRSPLRPRVDPVELLRALDHEMLTSAVILLREGATRELTGEERQRLILAANRVSNATLMIENLRERPEFRALRRGEPSQ